MGGRAGALPATPRCRAGVEFAASPEQAYPRACRATWLSPPPLLFDRSGSPSAGVPAELITLGGAGCGAGEDCLVNRLGRGETEQRRTRFRRLTRGGLSRQQWCLPANWAALH